MEKLLPIPTIEHIPQYNRAEHLCTKMDKIFLGVQGDIIELKNILDPFACPARVLDVFAKFLNANCKTTDSEDIKRHRIWNAITDNKLFGTWEQTKRYIDDICGGDARLISVAPSDMWMLLGDGATDSLSESTWAVLGVNNAQENRYGILLDSANTLSWQTGVFGIDVGNDHLTQKEIDILYETLFPITPVGMTIEVGYMNGVFTPYFILGEIL